MHSAIVLDINSGSVGAGIVLLRKHLPPALLYSHRKLFHISGEEKIGLPMRRTLSQVLKQTYSEGLVPLSKEDKIPKRLDHILVTLSSVWQEGDLKMIEEEIGRVFSGKRGICVKDFIFTLSYALGVISQEGLVEAGQEEVLVASVSGSLVEMTSGSSLGKKRPTSLSWGPEVLAQTLGQATKRESHLSSSLINLYSENLLEPDRREEVERAISPLLEKGREELFNLKGGERVKKVFVFTPDSFSGLAGRLFKGAYPEAEIKLETRDPLEMLTVFSNSLL